MSVRKLEKPYKSFPLTPHPKGYWVKVVDGVQHRLGTRWCDPEEALNEWHRLEASIRAGIPSVPSEGVTLREGMLLFLVSRKNRVESGEITQRTYDDYHSECRHARDVLGAQRTIESLGPADFSRLRKAYSGSPSSISNRIGRVRVLFRYLHESGVIPSPVKFGPDFCKPSAKSIRKHRSSQPKKLFKPDEIRALLEIAKPQMKAMIYLGLFAGFGNTDCGTVEVRHFNGQWVEYPRPKTGIERRAWLPKEAVEVISGFAPARGVLFRTKYGNPWSQDRKSNPIAAEFRKLARPLGIDLGFYALRHTCQTVGDRSKDPVAVMSIMGHVVPGMSQTYREEVDDDRLSTVGETISAWLELTLRAG